MQVPRSPVQPKVELDVFRVSLPLEISILLETNQPEPWLKPKASTWRLDLNKVYRA